MKPAKKGSVQPIDQLSDRALRSREKIKDAARALLNEAGYGRLRVQDVTRRAGVAAGLFYRYFHDLRDVVHEVARDLMDDLNAATAELPPAEHPYDFIYQIHALAVDMFGDNPGVLRCLFQLEGDYPEFGQVWKNKAHDWNLRVAAFLRETTGAGAADSEHMSYVLGATTEGVLFQYLIRHTEDLSSLTRAPEDIAEVIAVMWYRAIFLRNPPPEKLRTAHTLTAINRAD